MSAIVDITADAYHADTVSDTPSLSASIATILCARSPANARAAHPKLNPDFAREEKQKFDVGNAAHALFLEGRDAVQVVDANDWRTKSAQAERDEARAAGKIPMLVSQWAEVQTMCAAVDEQLAAYDPPLFTDGKPEQSLVWEEDGVVCRARLDWLRADHREICDLKTTDRSASPRAYERALCGVGGDVQAAFYLRGLQAVTGSLTWASFAWAVVETSPPYVLSVIRPASDLLELGDRKVKYALRVWRECLESGVWPGYGSEVHFAHAPEWEMARWLEREAIEEAA